MNLRCVATLASLVVAFLAASGAAQTPQPFPRPGSSRGVLPPGAPSTDKTPPAGQVTPPASVQPPAAATPAPQNVTPSLAAPEAPAGAPDEASLGVPLYPGAQFLSAFDAGKGQRYYLYGTPASFLQVVTFYRGSLKTKGDVVFEAPPTHAFDVGRFREETMAFPPGVTVKDYTYGGSQGYLHVGPNAQARRFPTILQIVPPPAAPAPRR